MSRWKASALHLLLSAGVAVAAIAGMLLVWYPWPLFEAAGGNEPVMILTAVDISPGSLAEARDPRYRSPPVLGPELVAADFPEDPAEREKLVDLARSGRRVEDHRFLIPRAPRLGGGHRCAFRAAGENADCGEDLGCFKLAQSGVFVGLLAAAPSSVGIAPESRRCCV